MCYHEHTIIYILQMLISAMQYYENYVYSNKNDIMYGCEKTDADFS